MRVYVPAVPEPSRAAPADGRDPTGAPVDVDGPVAWREQGQGQSVVFLHGLGGSRTSWEPQLRGLSDEFRAIAWDMPGLRSVGPG